MEHVAEIVGAGESEAAVYLGRDVVVADLLAEDFGERGGHLRAGEIFAGDRDGGVHELFGVFENTVGAFPDVFGGDAGQFFVAHREGDRERSVRSFFRAHAGVDEVVPIEAGQQKSGGHTGVGEEMVGGAFGVEVRNFVFTLKRGHAVVVQRYPLSRVFQRGPDRVL